MPRLHNDSLVVLLAGIGAGLAVIAQSDVPPPVVKLAAAAIAAGATAILALLRRPGQPPNPPGVR